VNNNIFVGNSALLGAGIKGVDGSTTNANNNTFYNNLSAGSESASDCDGCASNSDTTDGDPKLAVLGSYGGPTQTMLPLLGSAAICVGSFAQFPADVTTDQRGFALNSSCVDVGAVQTNYLTVNTTADSSDGACGSTCSLRDALQQAGSVGMGDIAFAASADRTVTLGSMLPALTGTINSGPVTQLLGGQISFGPGNIQLLRDILPAMLRIPSLDPSSGRLQKLLEWIGEEAVSERPGRGLMLERLLEIMLIEALRLNPLDSGITHGLLAAMADPQLAAPLHVMHAKFQRNWTVTKLASVSGMSRSVFAERFARVVGLAPIDYLLHLRMAIAKDTFLFTEKRPTEVAFLCSYKSLAAFSTAFRRIVGSSPGAYAKEAATHTI
jgi:CSLREA domain-containing protein